LPINTSATDGVIMYESHFGFHRQPFQCTDLARAFLVSESIRGILPQLLHALRSDLGVAVLTGPSGAGRSSLLRHVQSLLSNDGRTLICSGASLETSADVLLALQTASQLKTGEKAPAAIGDGGSPPSRWTVVEQMRKTIEFWGPVLLLIDDAQLLSGPILNELRAFTEEEWNGRGLVRILVSGPLSFEEDLARPTCSDFSRRIRCHAFLQPLTTKESMEFLNRHLEAAGGRLSEVFTAEAMELIVSACDGLPRCLSLLADESLVVAAELSRKKTDDDCVQKALTRLQHLPYAWSASPIRSHNNSFVENDVIEHSSKPTTILSDSRPAPTVSQGVIEFGAPGVIEFGGGPVDSSFNSRFMNWTNDEEPERGASTEPLMIHEDPAMDHSSSESEDVPFLSDVESHVCSSTVEGVSDEGVSEWGPQSDDNFGDTAATWIPLDGHFEPGPCSEDPIEIPTRSTSCITFFCDEATEDEEAEPAVDELSCHSDVTRISNSQFVHEAFRSQTPVFDRYTWISLGRDVSGVSRSQSSELTGPQADTDCLLLEAGHSSAAGEAVATNPRNSIRVTRTSDQEIARLLSGDESEHKTGAFFAFRSPTLVIKSGHEAWDDEEGEGEGKECPEESFAEEIEATVGSESAWQDGQLIFGHETSDPADVQPVVATPRTETTSIESEQVSLSFEAARIARSEPDQDANDAIENDGEESTPERGTFFTLPIDVNTIEWDLRSELADPVGVFPLAESLASLRNEVTSFQQNRRNILSDDSDGPEQLGEASSSADSTVVRDSLVARAKRQLEGMPSFRSAEVHVVDDHRTLVSVHDDRSSSPTAEEPNSDAARTDSSLPNFGQLFTRLRQKRQQAVENDCR